MSGWIKETPVELLREFSCSYGSAARRKATYKVGQVVTLRVMGQFVRLSDGMYTVKENPVEGEDYKLIDQQ